MIVLSKIAYCSGPRSANGRSWAAMGGDFADNGPTAGRRCKILEWQPTPCDVSWQQRAASGPLKDSTMLIVNILPTAGRQRAADVKAVNGGDL